MSLIPPTPETAEAIRAAVERTRKSYDAMPYASAPLIRAHPGRMAANARFYGLETPEVPTARVLEIGCASGGHIIPLAAALPRARFVGIDLSPRQIADGQARIHRLGLHNIQLDARSLDDLGPEDGAFDYIICHGVFSWVPEPLRDDLMRVCRERLSETGVAMISFNVLPGWRLFQIARDSLLLHASLQADPTRRAEQAQQLFAWLAEESRDKHTYGRFWRDEAQRMAKGGDAYIAHELFEDWNEPCTFVDFAARLRRHAMTYLCEAAPAANMLESLAPEGAQTIQNLSRGDAGSREQYIDIFSGRSFREALIVHAGRSQIDPSPDEGRLEAFELIAPLKLAVTPIHDRLGAWLISDADEGVTVDDAEVVAAILRLIERLPASSRLDELAPDAEKDSRLRRAIVETLSRMLKFGFLAISTEPVVCATKLAERPKAWSLAAGDARHGFATVSLRHAAVRLEPLERLLLPLLDGERRRDDIVAFAVDMATTGALQIEGAEGPIVGRENLIAALGPAADRCLQSLLKRGLLVQT
jgi:2-polyprenyl-3-methyl-5-hydroxy-6-metoxy-1,4-benzoquinol methylase/methyltransferase-like protein